MTGPNGQPLTVAVHGLGYVGSVSAACLADQGHRVIGIDTDEGKIAQIDSGVPTVVEPGLAEIVGRVTNNGRLEARRYSPQLLDSLVSSVDIHLVCVGTPSRTSGSPDADAVASVVDAIVASLVADRHLDQTSLSPSTTGRARGTFPVIVVRSTVLPGTVDAIGDQMKDRHGLSAGVDFGLAMCPEFLREASAVRDFLAPPFTVAGVGDARSQWAIERLFDFTGQPVHSVSVTTAETIKYACNAFHAMKVTFANEIGRWAQAVGAHGQSVMDIFCQDTQLNVSPAYLRPGFAFGGSCLPKDLRAIAYHSRQLDLELPLLGSVLPSNDRHFEHTIRLIESYHPGRVTLLGLTFKTGTDDLRESPYVGVAERLLGRGLDIRIWDPDLDWSKVRGTNRSFIEQRLPHLAKLLYRTPEEALDASDVALLGTSHSRALTALSRQPDVTVVDAEGSLSLELRDRAQNYVGVAW